MQRLTRKLLLLVGCALGLTTFVAAAETPSCTTIYISPLGNDTWSGSLADPNAGKTDGPLATLEAARDKIRAMKQAGPLPVGGVTVVLRGGMYLLPHTIQLEAGDSGAAESPIVYRAAEGEKVQIVGGQLISGFVPYRDQILKAKVSAQSLHGVRIHQLFFDGQRQRLARYPNFDPANPYAGGWAYADGQHVGMFENVPNENCHTLHYREQDARQWSRPEEGEVFVLPRYNWWNNIVPIASVDWETRLIRLASDASYAIRPGDRYYVQNLMEELDAPGEWYFDKRDDTLYFFLAAHAAGAKTGLCAHSPDARCVGPRRIPSHDSRSYAGVLQRNGRGSRRGVGLLHRRKHHPQCRRLRRIGYLG